MVEIALSVALLIVGFVLLIKGADFFVEGSSSVAKKLRVPSIIIGLTIVAMGTSLPELAVSATASLSGNNELAVSNVIGSNIFNLMVVCGSCALFAPLLIQKESLIKEFPFSVACTVLLAVLGWLGMALGHFDGALLLVLFVLYLLYMVRTALKAREEQTVLTEQEEDSIQILPVWRCIVYIVGGIIGIVIGGDFVVDSACTIAAAFGLSQNLIGLTIVAVGTSLPELVTSVVAAHKKELDMALGNVIGSNVFNILLILGFASAVSPIGIITENFIDISLLLGMSVLVWILGWTRQRIGRYEGLLMIGIYIAYLFYICVR